MDHGQHLLCLCRTIARLARHHRLLIIPGGAAFADVVRYYYLHYGLNEKSAHHMALFAMDQYGRLLGNLIPGSITVSDLVAARQAAESGRPPVLLPAQLVVHADPLPHSWQVTSDTIAAWLAAKAEAQRLILVKDVDGLFSIDSLGASAPHLLKEMTVAELAEQVWGAQLRFSRIESSGSGLPQIADSKVAEWFRPYRESGFRPSIVDPHLPLLLSRMRLEVWIINGCHPERLEELLETGQTVGTRISPR